MKVKKILADGTIKYYTYDRKNYKYNKGTLNAITGKYHLHGIPYQEFNKQKVTCECGCELVRRSLPYHMKSKKHINKLNVINI